MKGQSKEQETPVKGRMNPRARAHSFTYATNGIFQLLRSEPNARLHTLATVAVIVAGIWRHITHVQWLAVTICIALVWITEALNTCIEKLCDFSCGDKFHPAIKVIKDIAAAAVLIAALASLVTFIIIFIL